MAETGGITYADVSSFGLSDTGVSRYRTPDPLPLPIAARDAPYQPIPLTEYSLAPYRLAIPGLDAGPVPDNALKYLVIRPFAEGAIEYDIGIPSKYSDRSQSWFYKNDGTVIRDADIQRENARVLAAYHLDGRTDLIEAAIARGAVSRATVDQINMQLPYVEQAQRQAFVDYKYQQAYDELDRKQTSFGLKNMGILLGTVALSMIPGAAPFVAAAFAAYTVAVATEEQVRTGRVTGRQVIGEVLAVAGAAGAVQGSIAKSAAAAKLAASPLPEIGTAAVQPVALSGSSLQASFAAASGTPLVGTPALQGSLFHTSIAPALTQAERLGGGILTQSIFQPLAVSPIAQAGQYVKNNPVKVALGVKETVEFTDVLRSGDLNQILGFGLTQLGVPFRASTPPSLPARPVVPVRDAVGGGQGGSSMLFSSPADPANASPWPWVIGAALLGLFFFVIRKG